MNPSIVRPLRALRALVTVVLTAMGFFATDPPHHIATANAHGSMNDCSSTCHKIKGGARGSTLTTTSGNANLCMSCQAPGGTAPTITTSTTAQALAGTNVSRAFSSTGVEI